MDSWLVDIENPLVRGHQVLGRYLLPGLAYIDLFFQAFRDRHEDPLRLDLRNVSIYHPLVVSEDAGVSLVIDCTETQPGVWKLVVEGSSRRRGASAGESKRYVTAEVHRAAPFVSDERVDLAAVARSAARVVSLDEVYAECRRRQLVHDEFMRAQGRLYVTDSAIYVDCGLSAAALESAEHVMFHPTLLDGSAVAAGGLASAWLADGPSAQLALPLFYESFRASALLQRRCIARVRRASARRAGELNYSTLEFFDEAGRKIAELKNLAGKIVRDPSSITEGARARPAPGASRAASATPAPPALGAGADALLEVEAFLRGVIAEKLRLPVAEIDRAAGYYEMGLDSAGLLDVVRAIEGHVGAPLSPTLLFEHGTIAELSAYLVASGVASGWSRWRANGEAAGHGHEAASEGLARAPLGEAPRGSAREETNAGDGEGIAIIGLSGRYPMASTIAEFWDNLRGARDCISEIPKGRWDQSRYFDPERGKPGKIYCGFGGFIDGVDEFDPLFFNISALEAQYMDPQERLFLQCAYETLEDAGYTRDMLKARGGDVGVFVGVMYEEYQLYGAQTHASQVPYALSGSGAAVANRVSYFFNLHGPSIAVDTMCSSSLTAIYLACQSLKSGSCAMAIAGGVNVSVHPNKYLLLSQGQFISSEGRCKSFGEGGDGYVPGEGVGAMLLKPLAVAIADEDHVYAVIKGASVNHGGKASGFTVPNPAAQAQVIAQALRDAKTDPRTISYVEAHGTGTSLGDPIEIAGLTRAFAQHTADTQYCAIGSVKSNIGHLESAAGISGVTKVVLQLRHRTLVPSLHAATLNPHIDFEKTPFRVQRGLEDWARPVVTRDGIRTEHPRVAGVSSFGAGGANAHVIIEELGAGDEPRPRLPVTRERPALIVLSAKTPDRLQERARRLLDHLANGTYGDADLADIAYTLQVGREALEHRLAFMAATLDEVREKLAIAADGSGASAKRGALYRGHAKSDADALSLFTADEELREAVAKWLQRGKYDKVLELWVKGLSLDWAKLYDGVRPRRISLPTYPFARERYWRPDAVDAASDPRRAIAAGTSRADVLHPLLHTNTSDFAEQRFTSTFTGHEFFFADHVVKGQRTLPGVAHLEMGRAALEIAGASGDGAAMSLTSVAWARPLIVGDAPAAVHIRLRPEGDDEFAYEIYGDRTDGEEVTYSQGRAVLGAPGERRVVDIESLRARAQRVTLSAARCYEIYQSLGFRYGPAHRSLRHVSAGVDDQGSAFVVARVALPEDVADTRGQYVLHPSVLDGALQASIGLLAAHQHDDAAGAARLALPFALERLTVLQACPTAVWVHVRTAADSGSNVQKIDLDLVDDDGTVCVELRGFSSRVYDPAAASPAGAEKPAAPSVEPFEVMTFEERWQPQPLGAESSSRCRTLVCVLPDASRAEAVRSALGKLDPALRTVVLTAAEQYVKQSGSRYDVVNQDAATYASALRDIASEHGTIDAVLCLRGVQDPSSVGRYGGLLALIQGLDQAGVTSTRLLFAGRYESAVARCHLDAWTTLSSSLKAVLPEARVSVMAWPCATGSARTGDWVGEWMPRVWAELVSSAAENVFYEGGERRVRRLRPTQRTSAASLLRRGGTYLITGGAGGLGLVFARHLCERHGANVVLTGRSELDAAMVERVRALEAAGGKAIYAQADVCDVERMRAVVARARDEFGRVDGVLHAAGVLGGDLMGKVSLRDFEKTLAPKIDGTLALDAALDGETPDFICYFSSMSAIVGDWGAGSYALGNRFQIAHAVHRSERARSRHDRTKVVALAWPVWAQSGMGMANADATDVYLEYTGQRALEPERGLELFEQLLSEPPTQQLVIYGAPSRWQRRLGLTESKAPAGAERASPAEAARAQESRPAERTSDATTLKAQTVRYLKQLVASTTELPAARIDADARLEAYGVDSVMSVRMTGELEKAFGSLSKTLLFEYQSLAALADYFLEHHRGALTAVLSSASQPAAAGRSETPNAVTPAAVVRNPARTSRWPLRPARSSRAEEAARPAAAALDIAIIGLSGRYARADDVHEFWENLKAGRDGITTIPPERWDHRSHAASMELPAEAVLDRGGFMSGLDSFDHEFFHFKDDEVDGLDPQEKLFLEAVWHLLEHAGYTSHHIKTRHHGDIGVYAGASAFVHAGFMTGMVAGRAAGFLHLSGPTVVVDSHSASSTTALHLACQALVNGDCELAIAGGVHVHSPQLFYAFARWQQGMEPERRGFSDAGGVIMSEGVGAALLKPLHAAVRDGDPIIAVIKGTALTSAGDMANLPPEPTRLADVIRKCLKKAGVDARTVGCAEAMAMGIPTGDYCEFAGFSKAFREQTKDSGFCAMGTVESNIGHSIAACGIAQLTKVALQIHHAQLVPTIKAEPLNPQIDLDDSPFYLQRSLSEWQTPAGHDGKRRGVFASRGRSGTLAAVVLEEPPADVRGQGSGGPPDGVERLVLLSAHTVKHLHRMAWNLRRHVAADPHLSLADLSYTTALRREPLRFRLAILASTKDELVSRLGEYLDARAPARPASALQGKVFFADALSGDSSIHSLLEPAEEKRLLETCLAERNWPKLAAFWIRGSDLRAIEGVDRAFGGRFIQIPLYPFREPGGATGAVVS
uniref:SorI n=1 Tax=Sorangium cellulosum TaxID=56 RepID=E5FNF2_SORCE|nr:SorI [Sorangium cellulosum]